MSNEIERCCILASHSSWLLPRESLPSGTRMANTSGIGMFLSRELHDSLEHRTVSRGIPMDRSGWHEMSSREYLRATRIEKSKMVESNITLWCSWIGSLHVYSSSFSLVFHQSGLFDSMNGRHLNLPVWQQIFPSCWLPMPRSFCTMPPSTRAHATRWVSLFRAWSSRTNRNASFPSI